MKVGFVTSCKTLSFIQAAAVDKTLIKLKPTEAHHCNRAEADRTFNSHAVNREIPVIITHDSKQSLVSAVNTLIVIARAQSDTVSLIGQGRKLHRKIIIINAAGDVIYEP